MSKTVILSLRKTKETERAGKWLFIFYHKDFAMLWCRSWMCLRDRKQQRLVISGVHFSRFENMEGDVSSLGLYISNDEQLIPKRWIIVLSCHRRLYVEIRARAIVLRWLWVWLICLRFGVPYHYSGCVRMRRPEASWLLFWLICSILDNPCDCRLCD